MSEEPRYEVKMTCEEREMPRLLAMLRIHPSVIRPLYESRQVQGIYFDSHAGRALADNLAGISERTKLRLRWYGDGVRNVQGVLECKKRITQLGTKTTEALAAPVDIVGVSRSRFCESLLPHCSDLWAEAMAGLEPVQWISYWRSYWITADQRVRLTVDTNLETFDLRYRAVITRDRASVTPRVCVLECKAAQSDHDALQEVVQALPLSPARCSKFVLASNPEHGPMISRFG